MLCHTVYAIIDGGAVKGLAVGDYTGCNDAAKEVYGDSAFAVEATQYRIDVGDGYDGHFYRTVGGQRVQIDPEPTEEQEISRLAGALEQANSAIDDMGMAIIRLYELIGGKE